MMSVIVCLIKLRVDHPHCLHELHRRKRLALIVQIMHEVFSSLSNQDVWIILKTLICFIKLELLKIAFQLVDSFQTLHHTIHIACIPEVFKSCGDDNASFLPQCLCFLFCSHVLDKLYGLVWILELITSKIGRAHV